MFILPSNTLVLNRPKIKCSQSLIEIITLIYDRYNHAIVTVYTIYNSIALVNIYCNIEFWAFSSKAEAKYFVWVLIFAYTLKILLKIMRYLHLFISNSSNKRAWQNTNIVIDIT